jgi:acetyl-CoA C-acetyltransferase
MFFKPALPRNVEPRTGWSMGEHAQAMARDWGISREEQDALAFSSHHHLAQAYERGFFTDLMTPFAGVRQDNVMRPNLTLEQLAKLKPVFDRKLEPGQGTLTGLPRCCWPLRPGPHRATYLCWRISRSAKSRRWIFATRPKDC